MNAHASWQALSWPASAAEEALRALAAHARIPSVAQARDPQPLMAAECDDPQAFQRSLPALARSSGLVLEPVEEAYAELNALIGSCAPALLVIADARATPRVLAVAGHGRDSVRVLSPSGALCSLPVRVIREVLAEPHEAAVREQLLALLQGAALPRAQNARVLRALLAQRLAKTRVTGCYLLRASSAAISGKRAPFPRVIFRVVALYALSYALIAGSWQAASQGALSGRIDVGWLIAWALALASSIPFQAASSWLSAMIALDVGVWLRTRILNGMLALHTEQLRGEGPGRLLGRVLDLSLVEALGLSGGLAGALAIVDVLVATVLLASAPGAGLLLCAWALVLAALAYGAREYATARSACTGARLELTHELIERMVGHRTRALEPPERWHAGEDQQLERYLERSWRFDRSATKIAILPRVWAAGAFACLVGTTAHANAGELPLLLGLAGLLVGTRALTALGTGVLQLLAAGIAWREVAGLVQTAPADDSGDAPRIPAACGDAPFFEADALTLAGASHASPLVSGARLDIHAGDRILLEGESGSGKSTLAYVIAGLREPESGLLTLHGYDQKTLGSTRWRSHVALVPQFHDNYVMSASFAFNLLLGRSWPPAPEDLREAEQVCQELGLGALIDRMPSGLGQPIGETGWQLSHGEQARMCVARAILSGAELIVLDESLGALDPETATLVLQCVEARARTLVLIAHT